MSGQVKPVLQKPPGYRDPSAPPKTPARRPVLPPSFRPAKKKRTRACCRACCCIMCVVLLIVVLLTAIAGCVFYLLFEPRMPVFHLQSVEFPRFNVTVGQDGPALDSEAVVRIEVRNRNSVLKVNYGKTDVSLNGDGVDLGKGSLPAFTQAKKNTTVLKLTTQVKGLLLEIGAVTKLKDGFRTKSLVMGTEVKTEVGMGCKGWKTMKVPIKARCEGVRLKDVEGGAVVPKCTVNVFNLVNINT